MPVNFGNLRHPKRDMIWVAGAGPRPNFVMALGVGVPAAGGSAVGTVVERRAVHRWRRSGIWINLVLMALNLLPIPPLDGGRIAVGLLPHRAANALARVEPYGFFVILALLAIPGALWTILGTDLQGIRISRVTLSSRALTSRRT